MKARRDGKNNGNFKHGGKGTKLYRIWEGMKSRCFSPTNRCYKDYGGRGISVCDSWKNDYAEFEKWANANGYSEELSIDRIDNMGNYEPSNCRWVSMREQVNNRRNTLMIQYNGKAKPFQLWAEELGIKPATLYNRIVLSGWSIERAFTEPVKSKKKALRKERENRVHE